MTEKMRTDLSRAFVNWRMDQKGICVSAKPARFHRFPYENVYEFITFLPLFHGFYMFFTWFFHAFLTFFSCFRTFSSLFRIGRIAGKSIEAFCGACCVVFFSGGRRKNKKKGVFHGFYMFFQLHIICESRNTSSSPLLL